MDKVENIRITSNVGKLSKLLGKNLYENPYTFVTEVVCNAYDAHKRVNQDKFIEVKINSGYLTIKDYGVGMTMEEFSDKIGVVGDSDKEGETNSIGMYGIGSIAFTKYYHTCEYICVKNGKKFTATLHEEEYTGLTITYSSEIDTDEETSTTFKIKVINPHNLIDEIESRLRFFDNIFTSFDNNLTYNNTVIHEYDTFQYVVNEHSTSVGLEKSSNLLIICLENVPYPIKWDFVGLDPINIKAALKFKNGEGLIPTLTRESLELNSEYKKVIKDKIELFYEELRLLYNEQVANEEYSVVDIVDIVKGGDYLKLHNRVMISTEGNNKRFFETCSKPNIDNIPSNMIYKYSSLMGHFYNIVWYVDGISVRNGEDYSYILRDYKRAFSITKVMMPDRKLKKHEKEFLRLNKGVLLFIERKDVSNKYVIEKLLTYRRDMSKQYKEKKYNIWRDEIKAIKRVHQEFIKDIKTIEDLKIPEPPKKKRASKPKLELGEGDIKLSYTAPMKINKHNQNCIFEERAIPVKDLPKNPLLTVYGEADCKEKFDKFYEAYYGNNGKYIHDNIGKVDFAIVNKTTKKYLDKVNLHNFITLETFMEGKTMGFKRLVTASLIHQLMKNPVFEHIDSVENIIHHSYIDELRDLAEYRRNNIYTSANLDEIYAVAEEYNLYDMSIHPLYEKVKGYIHELEFISDMMIMYGNLSPTLAKRIDIKTYIQQLCKVRKIKIHQENILEQVNL